MTPAQRFLIVAMLGSAIDEVEAGDIDQALSWITAARLELWAAHHAQAVAK
jgi:cellobiose-specific phosphotransferase system component IIA